MILRAHLGCTLVCCTGSGEAVMFSFACFYLQEPGLP